MLWLVILLFGSGSLLRWEIVLIVSLWIIGFWCLFCWRFCGCWKINLFFMIFMVYLLYRKKLGCVVLFFLFIWLILILGLGLMWLLFLMCLEYKCMNMLLVLVRVLLLRFWMVWLFVIIVWLIIWKRWLMCIIFFGNWKCCLWGVLIWLVFSDMVRKEW